MKRINRIMRGTRKAVTCGVLAVVLSVTLGIHSQALGATPIAKADWIYTASNHLLTNMPQVDAFMWFNNEKDETFNVGGVPKSYHYDWRIVPDASQVPNPMADPQWKPVIDAYNASWGRLQRGVYIEGAPADMSKVAWFEQWTNPDPQSRIGWYQSFGESFPTALAQNAQNHGSTPYIVWQPYDSTVVHQGTNGPYNESVNNGPSRLQQIIDGDYNSRIVEWAMSAVALKDPQDPSKRIEICFGHEGNGDWFSWGYLNGWNGNTADMYKLAFQHVVGIFDAYGADNVDWVWAVNASWQDDFTAAFPGMGYVDRVGMDGFNWNDATIDPVFDWDDPRHLEDIFDNWGGYSTYDELVALTNGDLPIIISEMATPEPTTIALLALGSLAVMRRRRRL